MKIVKEHINEAIKHLPGNELLKNFLNDGSIYMGVKVAGGQTHLSEFYREINIFVIQALIEDGLDVDNDFEVIKEKMLKTFTEALQCAIEMY